MSTKRILFRADASMQIGTGHVMRCLTLADELSAQGAACHFLCRPHPGNLIELIESRGHEVSQLSSLASGSATLSDSGYISWLGTDPVQDAADCLAALNSSPTADWLVVDHYALAADWEARLRPAARRLMVLDDLADRVHDCDLLLDPGIGKGAVSYEGLIPAHARLLAGPQYAMLRPEFAAYRTQSLARRINPELRKILLTLGGVDKDNVTSRVLVALEHSFLPPECEITVVMGQHAPWLSAVQENAASMSRPTRVLTGVNDMGRLMCESDLAIGAAGSTAWERCCLGLPTIQVVLADNQREAGLAMAACGAVIELCETGDLQSELKSIIAGLCRETMARMSNNSALITDGLGVGRAIALMDFCPGQEDKSK